MAQASNDSPPVIVQKTYEFVLWLLPKVESFPRANRFTVGAGSDHRSEFRSWGGSFLPTFDLYSAPGFIAFDLDWYA